MMIGYIRLIEKIIRLFRLSIYLVFGLMDCDFDGVE